MRAVRSVDRGEAGEATQATQATGKPDVELCEVEAPSGDGVRVRIAAAGICGSDLHMLDRGMLRVTVGHELAGRLDDGTPVAIQPITPCGACALCRRGDFQLCPASLDTTLGVHRDGGMADEVRVDPACLVPLAPALPLGDACLVEPMAVCLHGLAAAGLAGGQRVLIVGAGSVGLLAAAAARDRGCEVDVAARHPAQLAAAEELGVGRAARGLYDVVVDAAGNAGAIATAVESARPAAELLLLGWDWERVVLPGFAVAQKELVVRATMTYGHCGPARDVDAAAALLARRPEVARALITHRFPLDAAPEAFRTARDRAAGAIKVVLEP